MIGDGMGLGQITAGMYSNNNTTHLERFPVVGLHKSHAFNDLITDSAAGATAFSCGHKTYNGAIAVNKDTSSINTILEKCETQGLKTGLVATSTIVHATPASFFAHNKSRRNYDEIASDMIGSGVDIFIGGGKKYFQNRKSDDRDLYAELKADGYQMSDFFGEDIDEVNIIGEKFGYLTSNGDPLPASQGRDYLKLASQMAINFLSESSKDHGFFLMIEGSQIDWGGHSNQSDYIISEFKDFDKTIGIVLDWAKEDGETLVIVTADHETGGYAIEKGSTMDSLVTDFTTDYHTGVMIPVFAYGPGSKIFAGIYENTDINKKMISNLLLESH